MAASIYAAVMSTPGLEPWRPSSETYHRMAELGIPEDAAVELLDGVIVEMTPNSVEHADAVAYSSSLSTSSGATC